VKRVLMVSPHYPPDNAAGAHRTRVLAPYLEQFGWKPTVLTLDRSAYEGELDDELAAMSSGRVDVIRATATSARQTRRFGVGDLGLRSIAGLNAAARGELERRRYDALYLTTYPVYPALLGPRLQRRFAIPFVLDIQDPWVGAWGDTVGGGPNGEPDLKSRLTRMALASIERRVVPKADAITSVSSDLLDTLRVTYPALVARPAVALPIGIDPEDVAWVTDHPRPHPFFDPHDGLVHVCYVGTLLPLAADVLRVFLQAVRDLKHAEPKIAARLRVHFIGTSNQSSGDLRPRALPLARELGLASTISEHPQRIPFADALRCQLTASAVLVLGSTEARYTASKIAPALASRRPVLVMAHADSDAVRQAAQSGDCAIRLATFDDARPVDDCRQRVQDTLRQWLTAMPQRTTGLDAIADLTGPALAERLANVFDQVATIQ
jgi:glycosyltransferase involved in cell wall biosynthesis